ncbi:MAG: hypothetical protein LPK38_04170, partial [Actinomycetes bacterium]|nr:hypothetical protein [Actinomycetes bacterium]MDX5380487.1 hypothetical protein [Actinomycetes bacterium]MDX5399341.1 hypothetical protein [Actinomycetes bacterium]MDX5450222.1 hypothetical protein [Actinomycetes bacterium]
MGEDGASVDLAAQDYADLGYWKPIGVTDLFPSGFNVTTSPSVGVAAAVVLNDVRSDVTATVDSAVVDAAALTVQALLQGVIRADADVTAVSSGGSSFTGEGTSVAFTGIITTNRILGDATATVTDSVVNVDGDVLIEALNLTEVDATTRAASSSGANALGLLMAFNTIGWEPTNLFFATVDALIGDPLISSAFDGESGADSRAELSFTPVVAGGNVTVLATTEATIRASVSNDATSAPAALFGAGGLSANGSLTSNKVSASATALVDGDAPVDFTVDANPTAILPGTRVRDGQGRIYEWIGGLRGPPSGSTTIDLSTEDFETNPEWHRIDIVDAAPLTVEARNDAAIDSTSSLYAEVSPTNDAGAGILNSWAAAALDDYEYTANSGVRDLLFGDRVLLPGAGVDDDGNPIDIVVQWMGSDALGLGQDLGSQDYADFELWKELTPTNLITDSMSYAFLGEVGTSLNKSLTGEAASYYALITYNDVRAGTAASLLGTEVRVDGDVTVLAADTATITSTDTSTVVPWEGFGGVVVTNVVLSGADALVTGSPITPGGNLLVSAAQTGQIDAIAESSIEAWEATSAV